MSYSTQVIRPSGQIDAANAKQFQVELNQLIEAKTCRALFIDLSEVDLLDSAGLMVLVSGFRLAQRLDKQFVLCAVPASVQIVLELTKLDQVLEVQDTAPMLELAA